MNKEVMKKILDLTAADTDLQKLIFRLLSFSRKVRVSEYHLTSACNLRCKGCWYYEFDFDKTVSKEPTIDQLHEFVRLEKKKKINSALLIGGEPALFPERVKVFMEYMPYVTISTNGLKKFAYDGFENLTVAVSLFGGGPIDDELRGIRPSGKKISGLFDQALTNYKNDDRVVFIYAVTESAINHIEETVQKIANNGNKVSFNYYSPYGQSDQASTTIKTDALLAEAIRVKNKYPEIVANTEYFIRTLITRKSHWSEFGYNECPSISKDHAAHKDRIRNGNPVLPFFNTYSADLKTVEFCCTSGRCEECHDSQAIFSWFLVNIDQFLKDKEQLKEWADIALSYWKHFKWSSFHYSKEKT